MDVVRFENNLRPFLLQGNLGRCLAFRSQCNLDDSNQLPILLVLKSFAPQLRNQQPLAEKQICPLNAPNIVTFRASQVHPLSTRPPAARPDYLQQTWHLQTHTHARTDVRRLRVRGSGWKWQAEKRVGHSLSSAVPPSQSSLFALRDIATATSIVLAVWIDVIFKKSGFVIHRGRYYFCFGGGERKNLRQNIFMAAMCKSTWFVQIS